MIMQYAKVQPFVVSYYICSKFIITAYNGVFNNTAHSEVAIYVGSP